MKCRQIDPYTGAIVWFRKNGSNAADNYAEGREAVICSLMQRLSVIKNELWYAYSYGIPLIDNVKSKAIMDTSVADIILKTEGVLNIDAFESEQIGHDYSCYFIATTKYGKVELGI